VTTWYAYIPHVDLWTRVTLRDAARWFACGGSVSLGRPACGDVATMDSLTPLRAGLVDTRSTSATAWP
jgi:hypothetical protein